jgi:hypothetical protein
VEWLIINVQLCHERVFVVCMKIVTKFLVMQLVLVWLLRGQFFVKCLICVGSYVM